MEIAGVENRFTPPDNFITGEPCAGIQKNPRLNSSNQRWGRDYGPELQMAVVEIHPHKMGHK